MKESKIQKHFVGSKLCYLIEYVALDEQMRLRLIPLSGQLSSISIHVKHCWF